MVVTIEKNNLKRLDELMLLRSINTNIGKYKGKK